MKIIKQTKRTAADQTLVAAGGGRPDNHDVEMGAQSDFPLVVLVARGRGDAMTELYDRHGPSIYALASRLCGANRASAVVEEVFLALRQTPEAFDPHRGSLRTYLLSGAHQRAVEILRRDSDRTRRKWTAAMGRIRGRNAESETLVRLAGEGVWRFISALPETSRRSIVLAYFAGYTYDEVADLLGQPKEAVKSHIGTGLSQLRTALAEAGANGGHLERHSPHR